MENDNQIKEVAETTGALLPDLIEAYTQSVQTYDLETEFAKTKKNVSYRLYIGIILFVAIFGVGAIITTRIINERLQSIPIEISSFDDINLRDLFDTVKKAQTELEGVLAEIRLLEQRKVQEIGLLDDALENKLAVIEARELSEDQSAPLIAEAQAEYEAGVQAIIDEIDPQIAELELKAQQLRDQIDEYDSRRVEQARAQEEQLDNQQRLFDIEKQELVDYYEGLVNQMNADFRQQKTDWEEHQEQLIAARERAMNATRERMLEEQFLLYNPVYTEEEQSLLVEFDENAEEVEVILNRYREELETEIGLESPEFYQIQQNLGQMQQILARLEEIPYENSIPDSFDSINFLVRDLVNRYEELWTDLLDSSLSKDVTIAQDLAQIAEYQDREDVFLNSLASILGNSREDGYVIDSDQPDAMMVFMDRRLTLAPNTRAYVYREDEFIASIRLNPGLNGMSEAWVEALAGPRVRIQPFDKILVEIQ